MTKTFSRETIERIYKVERSAAISDFPFELKIGNIIGVYNLELLRDDVELKPETSLKLHEKIQTLKAIGIIDDASANKYMDELEPKIEAWAKIKAKFDGETALRLRDLQSKFLINFRNV